MLEDDFFYGGEYEDLWSTMDELLVQYPELSELWLDRDTLSAIRSKFQTRDEQREYFRKRAFVSLVIEKIFRMFEESAMESELEEDEEEEEVEEGQAEEQETLTIDNPDFWKIWTDDIKNEYSDYPEFVDYVEQNVMVK